VKERMRSRAVSALFYLAGIYLLLVALAGFVAR
jgi:predicted nucleic acid-binding Zn ribbon protein